MTLRWARRPGWALHLLGYVPMAVTPGLVTLLTVWPAATGGDPDATRMLAAAVTLGGGAWWRSVLGAIAAGDGDALCRALAVP